VHVKDLLRLIVASAPLTADVARPMPVVPETAPLDRVLSTMRTERTHMALVVGTVRLGALGERLGTPLDHPDVDSVSGLVLTLLGRPARVGDAVTFGGYRFEVTALHGFGVAECAVRPLDDRPSAEH
jgi:CBS domain containing-hemolysin-like protein